MNSAARGRRGRRSASTGDNRAEKIAGSSVLHLFCLRPFGSDDQDPGEFEQATAQGRIVDPVIGADQFDRLAPAQRIGVEGFGSGFGKACGDRRRSHRIHVVEEEMKPGRPEPGSDHEAAGSDAVGASLIFLDLLKGQADRPPELFLAQAEHVAAQPHAGTDVDIDRARLVALLATRPSHPVGALPSLVDCPRKGSGVK